jgi:hypothetical protein
MTLAIDINVVKLFSSSLMKRPNKPKIVCNEGCSTWIGSKTLEKLAGENKIGLFISD